MTNWTRIIKKMPPEGVAVDTINENGVTRKMFYRYHTWYIPHVTSITWSPIFWKLPDPVADAAPEMFNLLKDIADRIPCDDLYNQVRSLTERIEVKP